MYDFRLLIGGELLDGASRRPVINPATELVFAQAPCASPSQLDLAVGAARTAFAAWSTTSFEQRASCITAIADCIETHAYELGDILTREQGKPLAESVFEAMATAFFFRHVASARPSTGAVDDGQGRRIETVRQPLGVVGAIVPWNYPLSLLAFKVPAALMAGNTVVLKPAPSTPLATLRLGELVRDILPPGVLNIIADDGSLGEVLSRHPGIAKISFTGSTETGKKVMTAAAGTLKRLTLELGGNDAAVVLADADPGAIAGPIFNAAFGNAGQTCVAIKRLYVHADVHDAMCEALTKLAAAAVVGNGLDESTQIGPLQNKQQYERVRALIAEASGEGTVIAGGGAHTETGYFIRPTLVRDISDSARLVAEEQFGPALPILKFDDVDDVIERVNRSDYGLGASVWSADTHEAIKVARRLNAGTVWINKHADLMPHIPFGGARLSGMGSELGTACLDEFTQLKVLNSTL